MRLLGYEHCGWTFTCVVNMAMWWNSPRPPCLTGTVRKNLLPSLEKTGSWFCRKQRCINSTLLNQSTHSYLGLGVNIRQKSDFSIFICCYEREWICDYICLVLRDLFSLDVNSMNKWITMMVSEVQRTSTVKPLFQPENLQYFEQSFK